MKRATISLPTDLETALSSYLADQDIPPSLTAVVQAALREFLAGRGYISRAPKLRITPAPKGSGVRDVSANHDHYLATRE